MHKRGILIAGMVTFSMILTGCFQGEQSLEEEMDPPQNAKPVDKLDESKNDKQQGEEDKKTASETVARELYLLDANGMVASQTLELPTPDSYTVASQVLQYLVKDGPVSELLPNGFQAVLPAGTEVLGVNLQEDGTIVVDLSKEFANYEAEDEKKILEAITYSLTQFENVKSVQLQMQGKALKEMPVDGTPISKGYSRANGINVSDEGAANLIESQTVTMFYPAEHNENRYYVPVTQYVEQKEDIDELRAVVEKLIEGPGLEKNVTQVFDPKTTLTNNPSLKDGILHLEFNDEILMDGKKSVISDEVMETIVRTMTEINGVDAVQVGVENVEKLVNENGEAYTKPVTKEQFTPTEKL